MRRSLVTAAVSGCLLVSVLAAPTVTATERVVDCGRRASLQAAIDAARPSDTLLVKGTCVGNFVIAKDLTLGGRGSQPTLAGGGSGVVVAVPWGPGGYPALGATVRLADLRITGGDLGIEDHGFMTVTGSVIRDNGRGIDIDTELHHQGGLTLRHSEVTHNAETGIFNNSSGLLIEDSVVADNGGHGVFNGNQKGTTVRRSTIRGNAGTGIYNRGGGIVVEDSAIRANRQGGIYSNAVGYLFMRGSVVAGNLSTGDGAGLRLLGLQRQGQEFSDTVIRDNRAEGAGGGIYVKHDLRLDNVTIKKNSAGTAGGGIYAAGPGRRSFTNVTFSGNTPNACTGC